MVLQHSLVGKSLHWHVILMILFSAKVGIFPQSYAVIQCTYVPYFLSLGSLKVMHRAPQCTNYGLKSEVSIALHCQLCSVCYTALRIKNCLKSTSAVKVTTMNNRTICIMKGSHYVLLPNQHLLLLAKINGIQRRTLVNLCIMHCTYCSMLKGTSQAKPMPNSEKIKLVALAVFELCLSEGIS